VVRIDPYRGLADGIEFDALNGLTKADRDLLIAREVVYCTEFKVNGRTYGGTIVARDSQMAERVAFGRGLGEEVVGRLVFTGSAS
jgi:hypothetical protein